MTSIHETFPLKKSFNVFITSYLTFICCNSLLIFFFLSLANLKVIESSCGVIYYLNCVLAAQYTVETSLELTIYRFFLKDRECMKTNV